MIYRYDISHETAYSYSASASISYNRAHLKPRPFSRQRLVEHTFTVTPRPAGKVHQRTDYFGNPVYYFTIQDRHKTMRAQSRSIIELEPADYIEPLSTPPWEQVRDAVSAYKNADLLDALQYTFPSPYIPAFPELVGPTLEFFTPGRPILSALLKLTNFIYTEFEYDPTATTLATPVAEVYENRRGVCQDFAHIAIASLRSIGLPARYVSGYIHPGRTADGTALVGAQATHAWVSVYTLSHGWVDIDPTNNVIPCNDHVTVAWGRDYDEISPLRGVILGGGTQALSVSVHVTDVDLPKKS